MMSFPFESDVRKKIERYGEKIAWTRQQYDILTALVAHTVGVEARTWAKLKQGYPDSALALIDELIKRERDKQ